MSNIKPLKQIKLEIDILSLDIDNMEDEEEKLLAVSHLERSLRMLNKSGAEYVKTEPPEPGPGSPVTMKEEVNDEILNNPVSRLYNGLVPTCTQCGLSFPSLRLLDSHVKTAHQDVLLSDQHPGPGDDVSFTCSQCDFVTKRKDNFKNHFSLHTGEFRCEVCNMNLAGRVALEKHRQTKSHVDKAKQVSGPSMTLSCKKCDYTTARMEDLLAHSTSCHPVPATSLSCELCGFRVLTELQLKIHLTSHTINRRCEICQVDFSSERSLKRHNERIQHRTKLKELKEALVSLSSTVPKIPQPRGVKRERNEQYQQGNSGHLRMKKPKRKSSTEIEVMESALPSTSAEVNIHGELIIDEKEFGDLQHQESEVAMFSCVRCNQGFTREDRLEHHLKDPKNCQKLLKLRETIKTSQVDQSGDLVIKPEFLGDSNETENVQLDEVLQFQNSTILKCEHCEEPFKNVKSLRKHMISHTSRYRCPSCNLGFSERQRLEKHLSNPDNCSKLIKIRERKRGESASSNPELTFSENLELSGGQEESQDRQQLEEEVEVFQCDHCFKFFSSKSSLKNHLVSHTDKFQCPKCDQGFSQKRFLETHIKSPSNCEKLLKTRSQEVDARQFVEAVISEDADDADDESSSQITLSLLDNNYPDIIIEAKRGSGTN